MLQPNTGTPPSEIKLKENIQSKPETMTKIFFEKFFQNKLAVIGAVILTIIILSALFASVIAPYSPESQSLINRLKPPSLKHLMGTDKFGRDIFTRVLYGARVSLLVGFASVIGAITIGTVVGAVAGYFKGIVDAILMRTVDIVLSIPDIFLLITLVTIFQPGMDKLILIFSLTGWTTTARLVRGVFIASFQRVCTGCKDDRYKKSSYHFFSYIAECAGTDNCLSHIKSGNGYFGRVYIKLPRFRDTASDRKLGQYASGCAKLYAYDSSLVVPVIPGIADPSYRIVLQLCRRRAA